MSLERTLSKKESRQLAKLNVFLRDKCEVPMQDSFRFAMVIVQNQQEILNILTGKEN